MRLARIAVFVCACVFSTACAAANPASELLGDRVGFDQHLNATIPLDAYFRDESGRDVQLGDYFDTAPVVLVFAYYGCSTLCPTVISDLAEKLDRSGLTPGGQYQVIVASIDAGDTPAIASSKKVGYLGSPPGPRTEKAWHLLTGTQASISALTQAAGFRALYDADAHQFAHPAGIVVLTPQGTIARYFFGFDFTPLQLRSALDEAAARHIASPVERLLLLCFHFDPSIGKHSATIMQALRGVTIAALLIALTALIGLPAWRRMRTRRERRSLPVA